MRRACDSRKGNTQLSVIDLIKYDRCSLLRDIAVELMSVFPMAEKQEIVQPEQLHFKDDGVYPGSVLPVLLYRAAITADARIALPFSARIRSERLAQLLAKRRLFLCSLSQHGARSARCL